MTLDAAAVEAFTHGRLLADDAETQRQLAAALAAARRYCGWHVTPVSTDETAVLDGTGLRILMLPTLALDSVTSILEDGVAIELTDVRTSKRGLVTKTNGALWTDKLSGIEVEFTHGYADAPDFESAVLSSIERGAFSAEKAPTAIGPFQYNQSLMDRFQFTDAEYAILNSYKLEKS